MGALQLNPSDSESVLCHLRASADALTHDPQVHDELAPNLPELEIAWLWGIDQALTQEVCDGAVTLMRLYLLGGHCERGYDVYTRALRKVGCLPASAITSSHRESLRTGLLLCRANMSERLGQLADLEADANEVMLVARRVRRPDIEAEALRLLSTIQWSNGNLAQMEKKLHAALKLATDVSATLRTVEAKCCCDLAWCYACQGDPIASEMYATHARETYVSLDNKHGEACALITLADASIGRGDFDRSLRYLQQAAQTFRQFKDAYNENLALNNMAFACEQLGDLRQARVIYGRARASYDAGNGCGNLHIILCNLGGVACALGDYAQAADYATQAETAALKLNSHDDDARLHMLRGDIAWHSGLDSIAHEQYCVAETRAYEVKRPEYIARALIRLSASNRRAGRRAEAERNARAAVNVSRDARDRHMTAYSMLALAYACASQMRWGEAADLFQEVYVARQRARQQKLIVEPLAGLLTVAMAMNDPQRLGAHLEELLRVLDESIADVALDTAECYLAALRALALVNDGRLVSVLCRAQDFLAGRRSKVADPDAFDAIPGHREIAALAQTISECSCRNEVVSTSHAAVHASHLHAAQTC